MILKDKFYRIGTVHGVLQQNNYTYPHNDLELCKQQFISYYNVRCWCKKMALMKSTNAFLLVIHATVIGTIVINNLMCFCTLLYFRILFRFYGLLKH